jgi:hypothetical protein
VGQGFELRSIYLSGWSVVAASIVLTIAVWFAVFWYWET